MPPFTDNFLIQDRLWLFTNPTHVPIYDFNFRQFFDCRSPNPYQPQADAPAVLRIGAIANHAELHSQTSDLGARLVNSPEDHERASFLPLWYPSLIGRTPRSRWFQEIPEFEELEAHFGLPFFLKGARQTSRHRASLSIIRSREDYAQAIAIYRNDPILHWQDLVCREFIPLRSVQSTSNTDPAKIPPSFEFRTFWWHGQHVGSGRYWYEGPSYTWTDNERDAALALAQFAAHDVNCPFLVIDVAMTKDGQWIVIECNDAMESGYAGLAPTALWQNILSLL